MNAWEVATISYYASTRTLINVLLPLKTMEDFDESKSEYISALAVLEMYMLTKEDHRQGGKTIPDFDAIAEITGLTRGTIRNQLAPGKPLPSWVRLLAYMGRMEGY